MTREQKLAIVYRTTHKDYKGKIGDTKTIMVYRNGTFLVALNDLTDAEIADRLPKESK